LQLPGQTGLDHFQQLPEAKIGDGQQPKSLKQMEIRAIFTNMAIQIVNSKPQKSQKVSVLWIGHDM